MYKSTSLPLPMKNTGGRHCAPNAMPLSRNPRSAAMLNLSGQALVLLLAAVASATTLAQDTYAAPRQAMVDEIRAVARGADTGRPTRGL